MKDGLASLDHRRESLALAVLYTLLVDRKLDNRGDIGEDLASVFETYSETKSSSLSRHPLHVVDRVRFG